MENASKALLIAASVLIVILVIAFSMTIFNSNTDSVKYAQNVGGALQSQSSSATDSAVTLIGGGKEKITFKVEGMEDIVQFTAEKGMTWEEFINSEYNTSKFSLSNDTVIYKETSNNITCVIRLKRSNTNQKANMEIKSGTYTAIEVLD